MSGYFDPTFDELSDTLLPVNRSVIDDSMAARVGGGRKKICALVPLQAAGSLTDKDKIPGLTLDLALGYFGHIGFLMLQALFEENPVADLDAIAVAEAAGAAAAGTVTFATAADVTGVGIAHLGDHDVEFDITDGDTPAQVNAAMIAAIQADPYAPFTAVVDGAVPEETDLTYDFLGTLGNDVRVEVTLPDGIATTATVVQPTGGATDPTIDEDYTDLYKSTNYDIVLCPWARTANDVEHLELVAAYMSGGSQGRGAMHFLHLRDSYADFLTWLTAHGREDFTASFQLETLPWLTPPHHQSAMEAGVCSAESDPSVPFQDERRPRMKTGAAFALPTTYDATLENVVAHGGTIYTLDPDDGTPKLVRLISTKTRLSTGVESGAWRSVHKFFTMKAIRRGVVDRLKTRFATRATRKFTDGKLGAVKAECVLYLQEVASDPYSWISLNTLLANLSGIVCRVDPNNPERVQIGLPAPIFEAYLGTDARVFMINVEFEEV